MLSAASVASLFYLPFWQVELLVHAVRQEHHLPLQVELLVHAFRQEHHLPFWQVELLVLFLSGRVVSWLGHGAV